MIRVATIGTSMITGRFASAVAACDGITLQCVYSRDADRARASAERLGAVRSSCDLAEMLARDDVDAVYVASPNILHAEQALQAIAAGKHVLIEKPACTDPDQLGEVIAAARRAGVIVLEAIRSLYDPGYHLVRTLIPELGTLRRASLRFHQRSPRYDKVLAGERVNVFDPAMGGGALNDLGVYCVHALVDLFGEPDQVAAASIPVAGGSDGAGAALISYPGMLVDLSYSKITLADTVSSISGESGTLLIDHLDDPRELILERLDGTAERRQVVKTGSDKLANMLNGVERFVAAVEGRVDIDEDQTRSLAAARTLARLHAAAGEA